MNLTAINCAGAEGSFVSHCGIIKEKFQGLEDTLDEVQMQIYIVSGVLGGVALILIIVLIALAIQLSSLRQRAFYQTRTSNPKSKPTPERSMTTATKHGESTHLRHQAPPHSYAQPPKTNITSEEELAQLGFSAYTGHHTDPSRGLSTSPAVNNSGGVRVLPRNPPTGFRNNGAFNDGYM